jgi:Zn-finger nucleic acid-binding protein
MTISAPLSSPIRFGPGARRCPACAQVLALLSLSGPHGRDIEVDHCSGCRLVWFDPLELDAIAQRGWTELLLEMARASSPADPPPLGDGAACPRCRCRLEPLHAVTDHGRHAGLRCPNCHGQVQRDGALLAAQGLFRPLLLHERVALATERRRLHCLPCGAALDGSAERCAWCGSPATVVDLPRLAQALGLPQRQLPRRGASLLAGGEPALMPWSCHGCGAALDATQQARCPQCAHPVLAPALRDLLPLLLAARREAAAAPTEAARAALRNLPEGQRLRISQLTGRPEHRVMLDLLRARFWRRWAWVMALFLALVVIGRWLA